MNFPGAGGRSSISPKTLELINRSRVGNLSMYVYQIKRLSVLKIRALKALFVAGAACVRNF